MLTTTEVKLIRSLTHKKYRQQQRQFILEGARLISAAIEARVRLDALYITNDFIDNPEHRFIIDQLQSSDYSWEMIEGPQLKKLSGTVSPAGIIALCPLPDARPLTPETFPKGPWLYLDRLADPGNLGTLLRSATWFGIPNIGLSANSVDPWNPKVVRGGMGAHFTLNLWPDSSLDILKSYGYQIIGADMNGIPLSELKKTDLTEWVLVLGGEAQGISPESRELLDYQVSIPRVGSGESLNVAVAAGILLDRLVNHS